LISTALSSALFAGVGHAGWNDNEACSIRNPSANCTPRETKDMTLVKPLPAEKSDAKAENEKKGRAKNRRPQNETEKSESLRKESAQ